MKTAAKETLKAVEDAGNTGEIIQFNVTDAEASKIAT